MLLYQFARVALVVATLLGQSVAAEKGCSNPTVRREWRKLAPHERAEWMSAVKCLGKLPHNPSLVTTLSPNVTLIPPINPNSSYFDDWIYVHMDLNPIIHSTGLFFPWHRAYVKDFETALREKCGFTGTQPYWNWTLDASNWLNSSFWDPDTTSGIGGYGDPNNDYQITNGAFADGFPLAYPSPHKIRRQFFPTRATAPDIPLVTLITPEKINAMINGFVGDFIGLQGLFEYWPHGGVHHLVGGDMSGLCPANAGATCVPGPKWSPNDPIFMMHHAMVDKFWYDWQHANPANFWSFAGGAVALLNGLIPNQTYPNGFPPYIQFSDKMPTDGIMNQYSVYEMMDTRSEKLCYTYE